MSSLQSTIRTNSLTRSGAFDATALDAGLAAEAGRFAAAVGWGAAAARGTLATLPGRAAEGGITCTGSGVVTCSATKQENERPGCLPSVAPGASFGRPYRSNVRRKDRFDFGALTCILVCSL